MFRIGYLTLNFNVMRILTELSVEYYCFNFSFGEKGVRSCVVVKNTLL